MQNSRPMQKVKTDGGGEDAGRNTRMHHASPAGPSHMTIIVPARAEGMPGNLAGVGGLGPVDCDVLGAVENTFVLLEELVVKLAYGVMRRAVLLLFLNRK